MKFLSVLLLACMVVLAPKAQTSQAALQIGIFADADSLPLIVAQEEGLFSREGVAVNLVRFTSAVERDSALQAGKLDGLVTDILAVMLLNEGGFPVKITSLTNGRYGIAASPGSSLRTVMDLKGRSAAISLNTIIHYFTDMSTEEAGLAAGSVNLVPIPKMPVRMEMLLAGQVDAAVMPEPFLTTATLKGARILAASDDAGLEAGVLAFRTPVLNDRLDALQKFYKAYWEAAQRINASPDRYRRVLAASLSFPDEAAKAFVFPVYRKPALPSESSMQKAGRWLVGKGLLKALPKTADLVDARAASGW